MREIVIEEAKKRLINRHQEEYLELCSKAERELEKYGGFLR